MKLLKIPTCGLIRTDTNTGSSRSRRRPVAQIAAVVVVAPIIAGGSCTHSRNSDRGRAAAAVVCEPRVEKVLLLTWNNRKGFQLDCLLIKELLCWIKVSTQRLI